MYYNKILKIFTSSLLLVKMYLNVSINSSCYDKFFIGIDCYAFNRVVMGFEKIYLPLSMPHVPDPDQSLLSSCYQLVMLSCKQARTCSCFVKRKPLNKASFMRHQCVPQRYVFSIRTMTRSTEKTRASSLEHEVTGLFGMTLMSLQSVEI